MLLLSNKFNVALSPTISLPTDTIFIPPALFTLKLFANVDAPTTFNVPPSVVPVPTFRDPPVTTSPPVIVVTVSLDEPITFNAPAIVTPPAWSANTTSL